MKIGSARRGPRVYSMKASSRFISITSIARGPSDSARRRCSSPYPTTINSRLRPTCRLLTKPLQAGNSGGCAIEFQDHLADRFLEVIGRAIDPQHAVDENPDAVGHAFHVAQDVRAEEDRASAALDDLDQRFEKIAADDRVQPQRRVVEDQQFRIGGHGQGQRDLGPLAVGKPPNLGPPRKLEMVEDLFQQAAVPVGIERAGEAHRLADGHPSIQGMAFGQVGDPRPRFGAEFRDSSPKTSARP